MRPTLRCRMALFCALLMLPVAGTTTMAAADADSAHAFDFVAIDGTPMPMTGFAGKAVLLVNTASFCGFTRQYGILQSVWERYRDRGLVVVGVPSNDFGGQEPGDEATIKAFCTVNFAVDFPMTEKQAVVGANAHPLYRWIAGQLGHNAVPRWNFFKYLIGADGRVLSGWTSGDVPDRGALLAAIEAALPPETGDETGP